MKTSLLVLVAASALAVSACCGQLPDLPEVAFGTDGDAGSHGDQEERARKAMSLKEAVDGLRTSHGKANEGATDEICVEEVAATFEVMTVKEKGGSVKLAVVPPSLRRTRQPTVTTGSTVTVTYKNPTCPSTELAGEPESTTAAPQENGAEAE